MNYYDETLDKIKDLIGNEEYEEAKRLIQNELEVSYVPRDFERKLYELLDIVKEKTFKVKTISDEDIEKYLKMDNDHQIIAVDALDKRNLRNYIDMCSSYLKGDGFINAKVLLIDSLIKQEINHVFEYRKNDEIIKFNPSNIDNIQESEGYISCLNALRERFMKEPSMLYMAEQLLYKEALMALPDILNNKDGILLAGKIEKYICDAFDSAK